MGEAIAAVATGRQRSAIGVIRLSGEGCIACAAKVFQPADGSVFGTGRPRGLTLGRLVDGQGRTLDQAMACFFTAPNSYTGEDACELHCHGSPTVLELAMEALFQQGVRQAGPGEFTKRAFLNGKLDLLEAEGVADLIDAQTPAAARCAAGQLSGALSRRVGEVYDALVDLMAHFHAVLDYPDEDIAPFTAETVQTALDLAGEGLKALVDSYDKGRYIKEGVPTAIVGLPNVGKSTLFNALVGYDRAIVTDVPGTTRDTVEASCVLGETLLRLTDTAGLRQAEDQVERLGVERSRRAMEGAALILVVLDGSRPLEQAERALADQAAALAPTVLVRNKGDLPRAWTWDGEARPMVSLSAKTGEGLEELKELVERIFPREAGDEAGELLVNQRQAQAARRALEAVERAQAAQAAGVTPDFLLSDVEEAMAALGELTGQNIREDIVGRVFERFCVGK